MAILSQNDKLKQEGQQLDGSQGQELGAPAQVGNSGSAFAGGGSGAGGNQQGQGGTLGWTNIQSYLKANEGDTNTSDTLNKTVGTEFTGEKEKLTKSADDTRASAQKELDRTNLGTDTASQLIQQAGQNYNYKGPQSQQTAESVGKIKTAMQDYGGPSSYAYGLGQKTQDYGSGLQDDQRFQGLLNELYSNAAGGNITTGQRALQRQLDTNNTHVRSAQDALKGQWKDLSDTHESTVRDTDAFAKNAQTKAGENIAGLKGHLNTSKDTEGTAMDTGVQKEQDIKKNVTDRVNSLAAPTHTYQPGPSMGGTVQAWAPQTVTGTINKNVNWNDSANRNNLASISEQRNRYNSILDALGMGGHVIPADNDYRRGSVAMTEERPWEGARPGEVEYGDRYNYSGDMNDQGTLDLALEGIFPWTREGSNTPEGGRRFGGYGSVR